MRLSKYRDDFKTNYEWEEKISIGKIDDNQEKAICFYNSKRTLAPTNAIDKRSYKIKPITILLRFTKNQDKAEEKAISIYEFYENRTFFIEGKRITTQHLYEEPNNLGTDVNGVYEYSLEINFLEER